MKVAIVILNWNTKTYLQKFLPPLLQSVSGKDARVIVADNDSTDGSKAFMAKHYPDIELIAMESNYGYAEGYNMALGGLEDEYYVLMNSDVEVGPGWLDPLVEWMDSHPECGACGPKILSQADPSMFEYAGAAGGLLDSLGYPFCRGRVLSFTEKDEGQYDACDPHVMWVSGACFMVRSAVFQQLGGFDERFFAHMEEIDLCWRLQLAGYRVTVVPESFVYHIGGGTLPNDSPDKLRFNYRNNLLMLENNLAKSFRAQGYSVEGALGKARRRILTRMLLDGVSALNYLVTKKWSSYKAVVKAHAEYWKLRRKPNPDEVASQQKEVTIHGWYPKWMVPRALAGRKIKF
jgi:GT2 family glycosyltransferase